MATTKRDLATLISHTASGAIDVKAAAGAWSISRRSAAMRLARLARQGWLTRLRRGIYYPIPLETMSAEETTVEDPWIMADKVFHPCYIAGWTAAEHWGLTEQLFRSTFVATTAHIRAARQILFGAEFRIARISPARLENLSSVWRGPARVNISSPERTIVDVLRTPSWIGGTRHLGEVLVRFHEEVRDPERKLISSLTDHGNGAAAKRLGFLEESLLKPSPWLIKQLQGMRTKGVIKLDPASRDRGHLDSRWGLWVNIDLSR
jgi:predicted transcriptional regulator of viral defense system